MKKTILGLIAFTLAVPALADLNCTSLSDSSELYVDNDHVSLTDSGKTTVFSMTPVNEEAETVYSQSKYKLHNSEIGDALLTITTSPVGGGGHRAGIQAMSEQITAELVMNQTSKYFACHGSH